MTGDKDLDRVLARLDIADCWEWTRSLKGGGYGQAVVAGKNVYVHRFVYERLVGPIPPGLVLDHLCRNRKCANPDHLEVVTNLENLRRGGLNSPQRNARKTQCPQGHPYDERNTYLGRSGSRFCRQCAAVRSRAFYLNSRGAA